MHALGWWHEQQRGDRDEHVKVWPDRCYWNEATFNVNQGKLSNSRWQDQNSPYDTASIMHYNTNSCASGADPVITKPDGSPLILSKGSSLSKQDIWQINQIYNCGMTTTQAPTTQSTKPPVGECDDDWELQRIGENSLCFKYVGISTWAEAVTLCDLENAELPLPRDSKEDTDFYNYLNSIGYLSSWLDGTDQVTEGIWLDSAGNKITFFNWRGDQPDNNSGKEHFIHYRGGWGGLWNDHLASHNDHVVCQKPSFGESYFISYFATLFPFLKIFKRLIIYIS